MKIKFPPPAKKLFHVEISAVELEPKSNHSDDVSFNEFRMRKESVIARNAVEAANRVKLIKNRHFEEFVFGVSMVSEIDIL